MHAGVERERAVGRAIDQIVDVALHRADMVLEARALVGKARKHEAAIFTGARRARESERILVESRAAALRNRNRGELAVGVERPAVIAACEPLRVAAALVDHLGAAVGAAVEQHMHRTVAVARHDHRLAAKLGGDVVARVRHLAGMADKKPGAAEDPLHFQFEQVGIRIDAPVHAPGLDQLGNLFGVSVAHVQPVVMPREGGASSNHGCPQS